MLEIVKDGSPAPQQEIENPAAGDRPDLTRKGFIITYPMFRYWRKEEVSEGLARSPLNVYIHTPYCIQRCAYCWFKTTTLKQNRLQEINRYVASVCKELELASSHYELRHRPVETVYFGGGTPSLMSEDNIDRLFEALRANFTLLDNVQITFEGEPVTLTERKARILERNGVNRISLGIQSFTEEIVRQTGRQDTEEDAFRAIELAKSTGAEVNIDLISGLAGETPESWAYSVQRAISADVHNITIYKLELYANTPYYAAEKSQAITLPSEDQELEFIHYAVGEMKRHDYLPVNTFTFTKGGRYDQKHTRSKWLGNDNCAVGVSAFGSIGRWNYQNLNDIPSYTEAVEGGSLPAFRGHNCDTFSLILRDAVMGVKLIHLDHVAFAHRHGVDLIKVCNGELSRLGDEGFLTVDERTISLTDRGVIYGDYVARALEAALKVHMQTGSGSRARVLF